MNKLTRLLQQRQVLLLDGATGTNLFNLGLESGDAPELWNVDKPEQIKKLYRQSLDAGSDLFLTNTFGGNASRLKLHQAQHRVDELNQAAARLAVAVSNEYPRDIVIAGSVGPTGDILQPVGTLAHDDAKVMFYHQAKALLAGGVDVLWLETISSVEEFRAAHDAFADLNAPWCGTMSFDTAGKTMMGLSGGDFVKLVAELKHPPLAFGANCGLGASDLLRTVTEFIQAKNEIGLNLPIIAKGNAGIPQFIKGHIHYNGTPELMADYAVFAKELGVSLIGGCCGTTAQHLRLMRQAIDERPLSNAPTLDQISQTLGPFASTAKEGAKRKRSSRRG